MKVLRDQVVIRPDADTNAENATESGIVLPASAQQSPWAYGTVVALGEYAAMHPDGSIEPFPYSVGDRVQYAKHAPTDFEFDGDKTVKLIQAISIYAVITPELAVV